MISINMLCMSAQAYKPIGLDEDRNAQYDAGVTLENVYINYTSGQTDGATGKQPASRAVLYYDVLNSKPLGHVFEKGEKIVINNENYYITSIHPLYTAQGLQHYEIELN